MTTNSSRDGMVLTTGEVARMLRLAPRTVCKLIDNGILPGWRVPKADGSPGNRRVNRAALEAFAREHGIPLAELAERAERAERAVRPPAAEAALGPEEFRT